MKDYAPPERPGYRYETCQYCLQRWNIAQRQAVPQGGYACPHCEYKVRSGIIKKK
jgi:hypothetical protein